MYDFKYIEGFDPSIIEYSNPVKAGSIEMPIIKYTRPFSQRKYPIFVNPEKAGAIPLEKYYDELILKDRDIKRVKPKTYEKIHENTPLSVNLSSFISRVPKETIKKEKQIKKKLKKLKKIKKIKTKLEDPFDEEFKEKTKIRYKKSKDEILKNVLEKYKPVSILKKTKYSQKQIDDSYITRKKIISDLAKNMGISM